MMILDIQTLASEHGFPLIQVASHSGRESYSIAVYGKSVAVFEVEKQEGGWTMVRIQAIDAFSELTKQHFYSLDESNAGCLSVARQAFEFLAEKIKV